ncbi:Cytochrome oxidase assembly factor 4 [Parelaphostrongylus tenuis]|uniref:Cytochrome oxidase assembly factor 4 n=1 Tax=Parelaphostrongylus tenuis TaxID=148309 RepID=A0AAD5LS32_PARTN|nr:Cytochrome oxidase assembly factor 4 [Parelaphostrongylus tenuis]
MSENPRGSRHSREVEDPVEVLIRRTGCWDQHIAVVDCMGEKGDWRQCQVQVQQFKECMSKKPSGSKESS